jgi:hypothetical protein
MTKSQPLKAWDVLDSALGIGQLLAEDGMVILSHDKVKELTSFEIRKLNKQDRRSQVPSFFNGGGVMSLNNSTFLILAEDLHIDLPAPPQIITIDVNQRTPLIDPWFVTSEQQAIAVAEHYHLFDRFYAETFRSLPSGRQRLHKEVSLCVNARQTRRVSISGVQVEADALQIGQESVLTVEAKLSADEMHAKQLFLPMHDALSRLDEEGSTLRVRPTVLVSRSEGIFDLYAFEFDEHDRITSHRVTAACRYELLNCIPVAPRNQTYRTEVFANYEAPFPQADRLELVERTWRWLEDGMSKDAWVEEMEYAPRQFDYYVNALKWLRLATGPTSEPEVKSLAEVGSASFKGYVQAVISNDRTFQSCFHLPKEEIRKQASIDLDERRDMSHTEVTRNRRASTVRSWLIALGLAR